MNKKPFLKLLAPVALTCLALSASAQPYTITTVAGSPGNGGAQDGTNSGALFTAPTGLALDNAGTVFVMDGDSMRTVTASGTNWIVQTVCGSINRIGFMDGTNPAACFNYPQGVATDAGGALYVADTYNNAIRKVSRAGTNWIVTTIAGPAPPQLHPPSGSNDGTNFSARFFNPYGLALDSATNIYVADTVNNTIRKVAPVGANWVVTTLAGSAAAPGSNDATNTLARFNNPSAVAVGSAGTLFVVDSLNNSIRKMTPFGTNWAVTTFAGSTNPGSADGLGTNAQFNFPQSVTIDAAQNLFVSDSANSTIRKITPTGQVSTVAGSPRLTGTADGTGTSARFVQPYGIGVNNGTGALLITDYLGYTVRQGQVAPVLQISHAAGSQVAVSWPVGLTGYVLQACSKLPPSSWNNLSNGMTLSGEYLSLSNAAPGFYRLHKP